MSDENVVGQLYTRPCTARSSTLQETPNIPLIQRHEGSVSKNSHHSPSILILGSNSKPSST